MLFYGELAICLLAGLAWRVSASSSPDLNDGYHDHAKLDHSLTRHEASHAVNLGRHAIPADHARRELPEDQHRPSGSIPEQKVKRDTNNDGSTFLWALQDTYQGKTFFDDENWTFYTEGDPTHGTVDYVDRDTAIQENLVFVNDEGHAIIQGDNTTWLQPGEYRKSVRVISKAVYQHGLFILDLNKAPWGCGVWPAFWTLGQGSTWPDAGEIDIIEGVHDNQVNQVAFHTKAGCYLTQKPEADFTGDIHKYANGTDNLVCDGLVNYNSGCAVVEWNKASYGPEFDAQGGGVFAAKWDENGISVWNFFRAAIPDDIVDGSPSPDTWGAPSAFLSPDGCEIDSFFYNHTIIINITFCGDWAGNSYATTSCPGTCAERIMDPNNFVNATWNINSLKVYRKQLYIGSQMDGAARETMRLGEVQLLGIAIMGVIIAGAPML